jgi:putative ABC transport system substrate-binding protein
VKEPILLQPITRGEVSTRRSLIAVLSAITKENNSPLNAFVQGLKELGYADGVNVDIVYRFAEELGPFPCACRGGG